LAAVVIETERLMNSIWQDMRIAVRLYRRAPVFTAAILVIPRSIRKGEIAKKRRALTALRAAS
jgi:hypothetical protein